MPTIEVVVNARSGADDKKDVVQALAELFGLAAHITLVKEGEDLSATVRHLQSDEGKTIVVGGGDGTVSTVASAIVGTENRLGVIPLGTLNHFAKDLAIPLDLKNAAKVVLNGRTKVVDAAEVNGRLFINNSSLGLYPEVVHGREMRERLGRGKWNSLVRSVVHVFRRYPLFVVRVNSDEGEIVTRTPFVFIGNNEYEIEGLNIGARKSLDRGQLAVYTTRRTGRLALFGIALRALFGRLWQERDFVTFMTTEVTIETLQKRVRIAMDGEVSLIETPLRYRILPRTLQVIVPDEEPEREEG